MGFGAVKKPVLRLNYFINLPVNIAGFEEKNLFHIDCYISLAFPPP